MSKYCKTIRSEYPYCAMYYSDPAVSVLFIAALYTVPNLIYNSIFFLILVLMWCSLLLYQSVHSRDH